MNVFEITRANDKKVIEWLLKRKVRRVRLSSRTNELVIELKDPHGTYEERCEWSENDTGWVTSYGMIIAPGVAVQLASAKAKKRLIAHVVRRALEEKDEVIS